MAQWRMLACFAHPDDEAFVGAGVLAMSTARGVDVRLICATRGGPVISGHRTWQRARRSASADMKHGERLVRYSVCKNL